MILSQGNLMLKLCHIFQFQCKQCNFIQLIQSPSLQTRKEYKKWTNHQVAIVFMSPVLPAPPILDSPPRSILQDTQSSSSKQCQCLFSNFPYHPISYRLLQYPQPSNILNRQVANNARVQFSNFSCPPKSSRLFQYPQFCTILDHNKANDSSVSFLDSSIIQSRPGSSRILSHPISSIIKQQTMLDLTPLVLQSRPWSSKIFNNQVTNNASLSLSLSNSSYLSISSTLLQYPQSSSSKQW